MLLFVFSTEVSSIINSTSIKPLVFTLKLFSPQPPIFPLLEHAVFWSRSKHSIICDALFSTAPDFQSGVTIIMPPPKYQIASNAHIPIISRIKLGLSSIQTSYISSLFISTLTHSFILYLTHGTYYEQTLSHMNDLPHEWVSCHQLGYKVPQGDGQDLPLIQMLGRHQS